MRIKTHVSYTDGFYENEVVVCTLEETGSELDQDDEYYYKYITTCYIKPIHGENLILRSIFSNEKKEAINNHLDLCEEAKEFFSTYADIKLT